MYVYPVNNGPLEDLFVRVFLSFILRLSGYARGDSPDKGSNLMN